MSPVVQRALCSVAYFPAVGSLRHFICSRQTARAPANKEPERLQQQSFAGHLTRELHQTICNAYHGRTMGPDCFRMSTQRALSHRPSPTPAAILLCVFYCEYLMPIIIGGGTICHSMRALDYSASFNWKRNFRAICMENQVFEQSAHVCGCALCNWILVQTHRERLVSVKGNEDSLQKDY